LGPADFNLQWHCHWKLRATDPLQAGKAHRIKEGDPAAIKIGYSLSSEEFSPAFLAAMSILRRHQSRRSKHLQGVKRRVRLPIT